MIAAIAIVAAAVVGVTSWTFLEYLIHRWMGHDRRFRRTPFGKEHLQHHVEGDYFAPTWKKLLSAAATALVVGLPAIALFGRAVGGAYLLGLMTCYGLYELLHRRHHTHAGIGRYGRWARRHHFHHHLVDARTNFGVTTPLWDVVFGTYRVPGRIKVPPSLAMSWLCEPSTGAVRAELADAFELRGRSRSS